MPVGICTLSTHDFQRIHLGLFSLDSLVKQLPEANLLLLRHLFGVLHHIERNAVENQMNAFNLALCIAPNMLWLPSPTGPEEESKSTKKVTSLGVISSFPKSALPKSHSIPKDNSFSSLLIYLPSSIALLIEGHSAFKQLQCISELTMCFGSLPHSPR